MRNRSWLLVPGDCEETLAQAALARADAVVIDLDAAGDAATRRAARETARGWLAVHGQQVTELPRFTRWVRIGAIESPDWREDLASIMPAAPDGVILPQAAGPEAVRRLAAELYELETRYRLRLGATRIVPQLGGTPHAALTVAEHAQAGHQRLAALAWEPQRLAATLGAAPRGEGETGWSDVFRFLRVQVLLAAHVCGVPALEAPPPAGARGATLRKAAGAARADGFAGVFLHDGAQTGIVNELFADVAGAAPAAFATTEAASATLIARGPARRPVFAPTVRLA